MKVYQVQEFNRLAQNKWDKRYDDYRNGKIDFAPQLVFYLMLTRNGARRLKGYVATGWFDENYKDKCVWRMTKKEAIRRYNVDEIVDDMSKKEVASVFNNMYGGRK